MECSKYLPPDWDMGIRPLDETDYRQTSLEIERQ
jgi:hypothetical protein